MLAALAAPALVASVAVAELPKVVRIEPGGSSLPANALRLYVWFDRPARMLVDQGDVRLLDADGVAIPGAFMDFGQALWSPDGRRLTILFDPGRVKRDVEGAGDSAAPLVAGRTYQVAVGAFRWRFLATPAIRDRIDPSAWTITAPVAGTRAPLALRFDRTMDTALLGTRLTVTDARGARVTGRAVGEDEGAAWRFVPSAPWRPGAYRVEVDATLEDVAGNRVGEALDHAAGEEPGGQAVRAVPFAVAAPRADTASCQPHVFRFDDDCRSLAGRKRRGLDRLRYIPLTPDGSTWLTIGGEARVRIESLAPNVGIAPNAGNYLSRGGRTYLDVDLRTTGGWRVFGELAAAAEEGSRPGERPFDRSGPDMQQLFAEIPLGSATTLRIGRQELDLGGSRLVGARDQANLRLAFDMARIETRLKGVTLTGFWGRPVVNRPGSFDDTAPANEAFYGVTARVRPIVAGRPVAIDLLLLGRDRARGVYYDAVGADRRRTASLRVAGDAGPADYVLSASYQFGSVGRAKVSAYGILASGGYTLRDVAWRPRLGLDLGVASGDRRRGDGRLNSFDPLYPNLGYFSDAPVDYPTNWQGAEPSLTLAPASNVSVRLGSVIRFVNSRADGLYAPGGFGFLRPGVNGADFADTTSFAHLTWRPVRSVQLDIAYVHGGVGRLIRDAGGHAFDFGLFQAAYRF